MKLISWLGSSRRDLREFPKGVRAEAGWQLELVQRGDEPDDWKPLKTAGSGIREIRVRDVTGAFRIIYLATLEDRVLVLHAFQKKKRSPPRRDIEVAVQLLKTWMAQR